MIKVGGWGSNPRPTGYECPTAPTMSYTSDFADAPKPYQPLESLQGTLFRVTNRVTPTGRALLGS